MLGCVSVSMKSQSMKQSKKQEKEDKETGLECITKFQVKDREGREGQGNIYLRLALRKALGWKAGDKLVVKLNKTKDGIEIRKLNL